MKKELNEIYEKNVTNNFVLDKNGVFNSMEQSYQLGITEGEEKYNKLKKDKKEIYDNAYQDAYDAIWDRETAYLKDLTDLF